MKRIVLGALIVLAAVFAVALVFQPATAQAEEGERPPVECERQCAARAERVLNACLQQGGAQERCEKRAAQEKETCLRACRRAVQPAPDPVVPEPRACELRCRKYGETVFEACMLLPIGPSKEQCQRRQAQAVRLCVEKTCPRKVEPRKERPDPEACKGRCEAAAREMYEKCVAGSTGATPPEECGKRARVWLQECIEKNCKPASVEPRPEPGACREQCHERVRAWVAECAAQPGASPERCRAQGQEKLAACLEHCQP